MAFCSEGLPLDFLITGQYALNAIDEKPRPFLDMAYMISGALIPGKISLNDEKQTQFRSFALTTALAIGTNTVTLPSTIAKFMQQGDEFVVGIEKFVIVSVNTTTFVATITRASDSTVESAHLIGDVVFYLGKPLDQ
jgi:hypothetical protein